MISKAVIRLNKLRVAICTQSKLKKTVVLEPDWSGVAVGFCVGEVEMFEVGVEVGVGDVLGVGMGAFGSGIA